MRTNEMLEKMPEKNRHYLETLKADILRGNNEGYYDLINEHKAVARGYIRCLVDCGVISDFKTAWVWFTA